MAHQHSDRTREDRVCGRTVDLCLSPLWLHEVEQQFALRHKTTQNICRKLKIAPGLHCSQIQDQSGHAPIAEIIKSLVELRQTVPRETSETYVAELRLDELGLERTGWYRLVGLSFRLQDSTRAQSGKKALDRGLIEFLIGQSL